MDLQDYPQFIREKYQKAMDRFTYTGKEPQAKERLRHLYSNQFINLHSMAPEPQDWTVWMEECIQNADWPGLCRIINQRSKLDMLPCIYGSYTYEKNFYCMLECFVCGNVQFMERLLPLELLNVKNFYQPIFPVAAHLLVGLWHKDEAVLEWAATEAEQFVGRKKTTMLERAVVNFLLDLARDDIEKASEDLLAVCKGYPKDKKYVLGVRPFCTYAHGLYCLAQILLPAADFQALAMPKYKNFLVDFAMWRREHTNPDCSLWFKYPEDLDVLNKIFEAPPAQLVMSQPFLDNPNTKPKERQDWLADGMKWVNNHIDELWEMGVGQE